VKETFKNLNVHTKESKFISGINNQYNSESVLQRLKKNLFKKGVIYTSLDIALKKYPKIVKKYFSKLVSINDNKYAALNTAV
jgi:Fe-S cluster assembly protein SufB